MKAQLLQQAQKQTPTPVSPMHTSHFSAQFEAEWKHTMPQNLFKSLTSEVMMRRVDLSDKNQLPPIKKVMSEIASLPQWRIKELHHIWSPFMERLFAGEIVKVEKRSVEPEFQPNFAAETVPQKRTKIISQLKEKCSTVQHNRSILIAPVWHGTEYDRAHKILDLGFASLGLLDKGILFLFV